MALDRSALLEVLDALRNADAADRITQAAETIYQALIDAELTAVIGAAPHERHRFTDESAQRVAAAHAVHDRRGFAVADPQVAVGFVFPGAFGAASPGGSVLVRGGDGGLPARHLDAQGR